MEIWKEICGYDGLYRVENLEWCSHHYNSHYGKNAQANSRKKKVIQKTENGEYLNSFDSAEDAHKKTGVLRQSIGKCCLGKRKKAGGFVWQFG